MKKWFEKWSAEKAKRKEKNLPAIVEYRDETYVSLALTQIRSQLISSGDLPPIILALLYYTHHTFCSY
jgi:hypothetical protein